MAVTFAFDVFGTLIDTQGVLLTLERIAGQTAGEFAHTWRSKQLEYSFRRGLMREYEDFSVCTRQALEFASLSCDTPLTKEQKQTLLEEYQSLPAFEDVPDSLAQLRSHGYRLFAFSNGTPHAVQTLLTNAGIRDYFLDVVSVDEIHSFKPDPAVYRHFLARAAAAAGDTWLVSGNPFDVLGAITADINTAWLRRDPATVFDPWDREPTIIINGLHELHSAIQRYPSR